MSASFVVGTSSLKSERTIPRAQRVGNGRLQNRWAGARPAEPQHEEKPPAPAGAVNGGAEEPEDRAPEAGKSLEELFDAQEAKARKLRMGSKKEPPYTAPKRRRPQIDVLA